MHAAVKEMRVQDRLQASSQTLVTTGNHSLRCRELGCRRRQTENYIKEARVTHEKDCEMSRQAYLAEVLQA